MIACVILPTYNERENIPVIVPAIFSQGSQVSTHEIHVLVVDDNSPDGTREIVTELMRQYENLHLISGPKKGLGEAYKKGIAYAMQTLHPDLILEMDADLQHDPALIPLFIHLTSYGFSLVIGSRFAPGGDTPNFSFRRRMMSLFGNWLIRFIGGLPRIHDCTSGYRCIRAELLQKCNLSFLSTRGYSFQSSLLCELLRNGARVVEIPIIFPDRIHGSSKLSLQDQLEFLLNIPKIRFRNSEEYMIYCFIGFLGFVFHLLTYLLLSRMFVFPLYIAALLSIEFSVLFNFVLYECREKGKLFPDRFEKKKFIRFQRLSLPGAIMHYLIFLSAVYYFAFSDIPAFLAGIFTGIIINYSVHSFRRWKSGDGV